MLTYACVYVCVCMFVNVCVLVHVSMHVRDRNCAYVCECVCLSMFERASVCLRVCLNEIKKDRMKWRLMCCSFNVRRNLKRESKRTKDRL